MKTAEIFASIYGAEAGNLALKMLATGGVFLGGGITPKDSAKIEGSGIYGIIYGENSRARRFERKSRTFRRGLFCILRVGTLLESNTNEKP